MKKLYEKLPFVVQGVILGLLITTARCIHSNE